MIKMSEFGYYYYRSTVEPQRMVKKVKLKNHLKTGNRYNCLFLFCKTILSTTYLHVGGQMI